MRKKRLVSLILCLAMLLSMFPAGIVAYAETSRSAEELSAAAETSLQTTALSDDDIVNNDLCAVISAGSKGTEGLTGESLTALIYAYTDNPNADSPRKVRLYVEQLEGSEGSVYPPTLDDIILQSSALGDRGTAATTITGTWHTVEDDKTHPNALYYLEFSLPAGVSVSFEVEVAAKAGFDDEVKGKLYCEYQKPGEDVWEPATEKLELTWTGSFDWNNFLKTPDRYSVGYPFGGESITYSFSADNLAPDAFGYIYTDTVLLNDTLTLPDGLTLPENVHWREDGLALLDGENQAIYEIRVDEERWDVAAGSYKATPVNAKKGDNTISFALELRNADPDKNGAAWNPLPAVKAVLHPGRLAEDAAVFNRDTVEETEFQFVNHATLDVTCVDEDVTPPEQMEADATVTVFNRGGLHLNKRAVLIYRYQSLAYNGDYSYGPTWENSYMYVWPNSSGTIVRSGDYVKYCIEVYNDGVVSSDVPLEIKDTMPNALVLQEDSITIHVGEKDFVEGEDFRVVREVGEKETVVTFILEDGMPGGSGGATLQITYDCQVDGTKLATAPKDDNGRYTLKNVAVMGDLTADATVETPTAADKVKFTKQVVSRTTKTTNNSYLYIFYDPEYDTYGYAGNTSAFPSLGATSMRPTNAELAEILQQFGPGDRVEYLITVENNTPDVYTGTTVTDQQPFRSDSGWSPFTGGWKYYVAGVDTAYMEGHSTRSENDFSARPEGDAKGYVVQVDIDDESVPEPFSVFTGTNYGRFYTRHRFTDMADYELNVNGQDPDRDIFNDGSGAFAHWYSLNVGAYTTVRQSVVLTIPGDNSVASEAAVNLDFEKIVTNYRNQYMMNATTLNNYATWDYSETVPGDPPTVTPKTAYSDPIGNYPVRQIYMNTGVLATTEVPDVNNIQNGTFDETGDIWTLKNYTDGRSVPEDELAYNNKVFAFSDNEVVVNYVYLYNDSPKEMDLSSYQLDLMIPDGFSWLGFVRCSGGEADAVVNGKKIGTAIGYNLLSTDTVEESRFLENSNFSVWAGSMSLLSPWPYPAYFERTTSKYSDQNQWDYRKGDQNNSSVKFTYTGQNGSWGKKITMANKISPYSGVVMMYAVKENRASCEKAYGSGSKVATFGAFLNRAPISSSANMEQASVEIRTGGKWSTSKDSSTYRADVDNDGTVNTYVAYYDPAGTSLSNSFYGNNSSGYYDINGSPDYKDNRNSSSNFGPFYIWSFANLEPAVNWTSAYVEKEVVENLGEDGNGEKDGYKYGYYLQDGIHRTVDGEVTWRTRIINNGYHSASGYIQYDSVSYGCLIETIDAPYKLERIAFQQDNSNKNQLHYKETTLRTGAVKLQTLNVEPVEVPTFAGVTPHPAGENGWEPMGNNRWVWVKPLGSLRLDSGKTVEIGMRITLYYRPNGSLGYGPDVGTGKNEDCYQYVIEFTEAGGEDDGWTLTPELSWVGNQAYGPNMLSIDFTFSTDDSILTNYNSFDLVLLGVEEKDFRPIYEKGVKRTPSKIHNLKSEWTSSYALDDGEAGIMPLRENTPAWGGGNWPTNNYYVQGEKPFAGEELINDVYGITLEYSDWTDTSYTDGMKTISLLDKNGEVAKDQDGKDVTINSRANGDMTLPGNVAPGDRIKTELMVESVLYEAEKYDFFENLTLYDVFGVQDGTDQHGSRSGYGAIDFDSFDVWLERSGQKLETYQFKPEDLKIYYTTKDFVTTEHHPISPINTLVYAADWDMETKDDKVWIPYDPATYGKDTDIRGIKIQLNNPRLSQMAKEDQKLELHVSFVSEVSDSIEEEKYSDVNFPNVFGYTADVHDTVEQKRKHIREDTTATQIEGTPLIGFQLNKTVEAAYKDLAENDYSFLLVRTGGSSADAVNLTKDNIEAIALYTASPGGTTKEWQVVYGPDGETKEDFFAVSKYYTLLELDSGMFTPAYSSNASENVRYSSSAKVNVDAGDLQTRDDTVNAWLQKGGYTGLSGAYFTFSNSVQWQLELTANNRYTAPDVMLEKVDPNGVTIKSTAKFKLYQVADAAGAPMTPTLVKLYRSGSDYRHYGNSMDNKDTIELSGSTIIRNLDPGKYYLEETEAPFGFRKVDEDGLFEGSSAGAAYQDKRIYFDTLSGSQQIVLKAVNEPDEQDMTGSLSIMKVDQNDAIIYSTETMFRLYTKADYTENGENAKALQFHLDRTTTSYPQSNFYSYHEEEGDDLVEDLETYQGRLSLEGLPFDDYCLVEVRGPKGYLKATEPFEISITRTNPSQELKPKNELNSAEVRVYKQDSETNDYIRESSAVFQVVPVEGGDPLTFIKTRDGNYEYDENGTETKLETINGVLYLYYVPLNTKLVEIQAPKGYQVVSDSEDILIVKGYNPIYVKNSKSLVDLKLNKRWQLQGAVKDYPLGDVHFTLYEGDSVTAAPVAEGTTDKNGVLTFEGLDQEKYYYLVEDVPEGYEAGDSRAISLWRKDTTGELEIGYDGDGEGYTMVKAIPFKLSDVRRELDLNENGHWEYETKIMNIKGEIYGGMYGSVSYKTISNAPMVDEYGVNANTGYSFYYMEEDYRKGNKNYVSAVQPGDSVEYTLVVTNVSDYEFTNLSLIDRMPELGDSGVVNLKEKRDSKFSVRNRSDDFTVLVDQKPVDASLYTISFSDKVEFTEGDFNNTTVWDGAYESAKSFRVAFAKDFFLDPGSTVNVVFNGTIQDGAEMDQFAWNNFAYRYNVVDPAAPMATDVDSESTAVVLTPEPPKVGVKIGGAYADVSLDKTFRKDDEEDDTAVSGDFRFVLRRTDALEAAVQYETENGTADLPADGLTVTETVESDQTKTIQFQRLHFSRTGTYTFELWEAIPEGAARNEDGSYTLDGVTYDSTVYTLTIKVGSDGFLDAQDDSVDGYALKVAYAAGGDSVDSAAFVNHKGKDTTEEPEDPEESSSQPEESSSQPEESSSQPEESSSQPEESSSQPEESSSQPEESSSQPEESSSQPEESSSQPEESSSEPGNPGETDNPGDANSPGSPDSSNPADISGQPNASGNSDMPDEMTTSDTSGATNTAPSTGDGSNPALWISLTGLSFLAALAAVFCFRRKKLFEDKDSRR